MVSYTDQIVIKITQGSFKANLPLHRRQETEDADTQRTYAENGKDERNGEKEAEEHTGKSKRQDCAISPDQDRPGDSNPWHLGR